MHHDALRNHEYRMQALRVEAREEQLARSFRDVKPTSSGRLRPMILFFPLFVHFFLSK